MADNYQEKLYEKTTTPYWPDHCGHGGYLFSFTCGETDDLLDVYCWENYGQKFCLRFGDEGPDHLSAASIESLMSLASHGVEPYSGCFELLKLAGDIRFCVFNPDRIPQGEPHSEERQKQLEDLKSGSIGRSRYKEEE